MTVADIATAVHLVRDAAMAAASDPDRRAVACRLLDAIADAVTAGVLEPRAARGEEA